MPAKEKTKPNILVIWGDDIGIHNLSCYSHGVMGYKTPNIDRLAKEGMMFTDSYGEQSCTAGRASFITGQSGYRTGLTKVGIPGADVGLQAEDPTIAELLKPLGYATGQFGKNHLGDQNKYLPTVHGFDEFYGNLYHLNAEQDPEDPDYPKDPAFKAKFGPRGVLHCYATEKDDPTVQPRWGRVGKQKIKDTGPLTTKRMETCDDDFAAAANDFIIAPTQGWHAVFLLGQLHPHALPHPHQARKSRTGRRKPVTLPRHHDRPRQERRRGPGSSRQARHRRQHHRHLQHRQRPPHEYLARWCHDAVPQRKGHQLGRRLPHSRISTLARENSCRSISNEIIQHHDWLPTFLAAAGEPDIIEKLKKGHKAGDKTFKVHIDGYNMVPYLTGKEKESPRKGLIYFDDDGNLVALRFKNWKTVFLEQRCPGTLLIWGSPFTVLRIPKLFNLRTDPLERADITSNTYWDWYLSKAYMIMAAQAIVGQFMATFKEFPPRQKAASFTIDQALIAMSAAGNGGSAAASPAH